MHLQHSYARISVHGVVWKLSTPHGSASTGHGAGAGSAAAAAQQHSYACISMHDHRKTNLLPVLYSLHVTDILKFWVIFWNLSSEILRPNPHQLVEVSSVVVPYSLKKRGQTDKSLKAIRYPIQSVFDSHRDVQRPRKIRLTTKMS